MHATGFIVNVHDSINFDIDIILSNDDDRRTLESLGYRHVVTNDYAYLDLDTGQKVVGTTYRCRLRGIVKEPQCRKSARLFRMSAHNIRRLIDRCDGWVECTIHDVDYYSRLLVDITLRVPYIDGDSVQYSTIDLRQYILRQDTNFNVYPVPLRA
jgi:hypothetical protein